MENLDINKFASNLSNDPNAVRNWRKIYDALNLPPAEAVNLTKSHNSILITNYELFTLILESWKSKNGREATDKQLETLLKKAKEEQIAAGLSTSSSFISAHLKFPIRYNYQSVIAKHVPRPHLEKEIIAGMQNNEVRDSPINFPVVVLHGIGGVGKTTLARKICQLTKDSPDESIVWINSEKEEIIINDFSKLFGIKTGNPEEVKETLQNCYSLYFKNRKCLLVFDNVDDYKMCSKYQPLNLETNIKVIITSNAAWESMDIGEVKNIQVEKFTPTEFSEFVRKIILNVSEADIKVLDKYTGRIPYLTNLTCFGIAKWKKHRPNKDISEYLKIYDNQPSKSMKSDFIVYKRTPEEIVDRQINQIRKFYEEDGETAYKLLCILAYCESECLQRNIEDLVIYHKPIKLIVLSNGKEDLKESLNVAIEILIEQGFLEKNEEVLSIHRSYQRAIQHMLRKQDKEREEIRQLIKSSASLDCLNYSKVWDLGKQYGKVLFKEMINSNYFLHLLIRHRLHDGVEILLDYAKRTKSKVEFISWVMFEQSNLRSALLVYKEKYKSWLDYIGIVNFDDLLEKLKLFDGDDQHERFPNFLINVAFERKSWMEKLFASFPDFLNVNFNYNRSFLRAAAERGNLEAVEYFLERGLDCDKKDIYGYTPLIYAISWIHLGVVKALLKAGADPNNLDNYGDTPLHEAAIRRKKEYILFYHHYQQDSPNYTEIADLLLKAGADPKIQNKKGESPLHVVARSNMIEMAKALISNNSDIQATDNKGRTALDIALGYGNEEMTELLLSYQTKLGIKLMT